MPLHSSLTLPFLDGSSFGDPVHPWYAVYGSDIFIHWESDAFFGTDGYDYFVAGFNGSQAFFGDGNDVGYGGRGYDMLFGEDGDDYLNGQGGGDYLVGGIGNDSIYGGSGNDVIIGGTSGYLTITPGPDDDALYGGTGNDRIYANGGDDMVYGGDDNDLVEGGVGDDQIWGDNGDDNLSGQADNDTIRGGTGNDVINGDAGDDIVYGASDNDIVYGGVGSDLISGGSGSDDLYGGDGVADGDVDTFVFASGTDTIWDYEIGIDRIRLSGYALSDAAPIVDSSFVSAFGNYGYGLVIDFGGGDILYVNNVTDVADIAFV